MTTRVVNKKYAHFDVYIGRPGIYGNPVKIGKRCQYCGEWHMTAASTLPCFEKRYFYPRILSDLAWKLQVQTLKGKVLACHCKDRSGEGPCHGDVYVTYLEGIWL